MDQRITGIISRAQEGKAPTYEEVVTLIDLDETSPEATALRGAANDIIRARHHNAGAIWGQIGICSNAEMHCHTTQTVFLILGIVAIVIAIVQIVKRDPKSAEKPKMQL